MQIKDNKLNNKQFLKTFIKLAITIVVMLFIASRLNMNWAEVSSIRWPKDTSSYLLIVLVLMVLNWTLEAIRWKKSVEVFEHLAFWSSVRVILSGLALNWVFPFTSGDAIVRLANGTDKYKTTSAILLNRGIMLGITVVYGLISIWQFSSSQLEINYTILLGAVIIVSSVFIFRRKASQFLWYFGQVTKRVAWLVLTITVFRYLVFVIQFFLLIKLFNPALSNGVIIAGVGWIYFFRSVIPSLLGGIGVREASGIIFFSPYVFDVNLVIIPVFLIWVINNAIPSFVGSILLCSQSNVNFFSWSKKKVKRLVA